MNSEHLDKGFRFSPSRQLRHSVLWGGVLLVALVALFVTLSEVSAQEPPDLDGSLGYDSMTTCWRIGGHLSAHSSTLSPSRYSSGFDWAWPGCSSPGDPDRSCGPRGAGLFNSSDYPLSGAAPSSFFSVFPANLDAVLQSSGAEAVAYVPHPVADTDFVYRPSRRESALPTAVPEDIAPGSSYVPASVSVVPARNCFVNVDSDAANRLGPASNCLQGIPVFHSRRDYLNMLYGVVNASGDVGYASAYDDRYARDYSLLSPFSYSVSPGPPVGGPTPAAPWWSDGDNWERVPAREASHFRVGWLHPDAPEGGLTVDYAYLLRQQHYMNAELLANLRSYTTDGERVTRGIRSTPHAWVFNGLTTITCATGSTCTLSVDMNQVAVRQINVVYLEVNFNPIGNRAGAPGANRLHSPPSSLSED